MKGKRTHHVPLSAAAVAILGKRGADDTPLFEASSQNGMFNTLKANGGNDYAVHGVRSSFSDWVIDQTSFGADLADICIAHLTRGKVRAAYQRSPQLDRRRAIMQEWSDFCAVNSIKVCRKKSGIASLHWPPSRVVLARGEAARYYRFLPTAAELKMYCNGHDDFPAVKTVFNNFGSKDGLLANLRAWVQDKPDLKDIAGGPASFR
jgi:hypothetical protein